MKRSVLVLCALALAGASVAGCRGARVSAPPQSSGGSSSASTATAHESAQPAPSQSREEASEGLKQAILSARKPAVLTATVGDVSYEYEYRRAFADRESVIKVFYDQVVRVEVQEGEQRAVVHGIKDGELDKLLFETDAQAWEFERALSALIARASAAGDPDAGLSDEALLVALLERAVKPNIVKAQVQAGRYSYQYQTGFTRVRSNKQVHTNTRNPTTDRLMAIAAFRARRSHLCRRVGGAGSWGASMLGPV